MKSQDFLAWCDAMDISTAGAFSETLGIARNTAQSFFVAAKAGGDVPIKRPVALAMSALYHRLNEWRPK